MIISIIAVLLVLLLSFLCGILHARTGECIDIRCVHTQRENVLTSGVFM